MARKPTDTNFITADIALVSCLCLTCSQVPVCHLRSPYRKIVL